MRDAPDHADGPVTSDDRALLVGLNEAVFRAVNERLEELAAGARAGDGRLDLICECGDPSCAARLRVDADDYRNARSQPRQFLVHPGHVAADVERVVQKRSGYDLIEKLPGRPAEVAERTDLRS